MENCINIFLKTLGDAELCVTQNFNKIFLKIIIKKFLNKP
jgi:hypothetical protein